MKIAIIVHSKTGTTLKFARMMQNKLTTVGHEANVIELKTETPVNGGSVKQDMDIKLTNLPDVSGFDALCIGGPVWAFRVSPVIYKAIKELPALNNKTVLPFVTMGFPLEGMGGKGAINMMHQAIAEKGAKLLPGIIIPKMFRNQPALMTLAVEKIGTYF